MLLPTIGKKIDCNVDMIFQHGIFSGFKNLKVLLAAPRGFCAGVDRAIEIVKKSINKYGRPVYVTNQITSAATPSGGVANALAVPDSIHWATSPLGSGGSKGTSMVGSQGVRVQSNYIPDYLSTVTTADILYGVVLNRATAGVTIYTTATQI